jgi:hypothetical protein
LLFLLRSTIRIETAAITNKIKRIHMGLILGLKHKPIATPMRKEKRYANKAFERTKGIVGSGKSEIESREGKF